MIKLDTEKTKKISIVCFVFLLILAAIFIKTRSLYPIYTDIPCKDGTYVVKGTDNKIEVTIISITQKAFNITNGSKIYPKQGLFILIAYTIKNNTQNDILYRSGDSLTINKVNYQALLTTQRSFVRAHGSVQDVVEYDVPAINEPTGFIHIAFSKVMQESNTMFEITI